MADISYVTTLGLRAVLEKLYAWMPFKKGKNSKPIEESGLVAENDFELAVGKFNERSENTIFSVGVGTKDKPASALNIHDDGKIYIGGLDNDLLSALSATGGVPHEAITKDEIDEITKIDV